LGACNKLNATLRPQRKTISHEVAVQPLLDRA
jgi:hypothetical protein